MAWASLWIAAASGAGPVGKTDIALVGDVETHGFRTGGAEGPEIGENVALGDFDGDGLDDLFVGAASWDDPVMDQGAGYAIAATDLGLCDLDPLDSSIECKLGVPPDQFTTLITAGHKKLGRFATQLGTGDLDGDGIDDLVAAATGIGNVTVWYGTPDMAWNAAVPDVVINGGTSFGTAVAVLGDLNSDGCNDLGVGAHSAGGGTGEVYIWYTPSGTSCGRFPAVIDLSAGAVPSVLLRGPEIDTFAGAGLAAAGDVDGDGDDDILIGAPNGVKGEPALGPGEVWLVYGGADSRELGRCPVPCDLPLDDFGATGRFDGVRWTLDPTFANSWLGNKVAGVGDATGDGCRDLLFAAMKFGGVIGEYQTGAAFLVDGAGTCDGGVRLVSDEILLDGSGDDYVVQLTGDEVDDKLGEGLAAAGDVDGDGLGDLILGEYRDDELGPGKGTENGAGYVVYGGWSGFDQAAPAIVTLGSHVCDAAGLWPAGVPPHLKIYGTVPGDIFAKHVAGGGNVNGDGLDDLLLGAPRWGANDGTCPEELCDKGNAYVVYGDATDVCLDQ
jgi:hypothetical protein